MPQLTDDFFKFKTKTTAPKHKYVAFVITSGYCISIRDTARKHMASIVSEHFPYIVYSVSAYCDLPCILINNIS